MVRFEAVSGAQFSAVRPSPAQSSAVQCSMVRINRLRLNHLISYASMVTYLFYCFSQTLLSREHSGEVLKKIARQHSFLRDHLNTAMLGTGGIHKTMA